MKKIIRFTPRPATRLLYVLSLVVAVLVFPSVVMADTFTYTITWNTVPGNPTIMPEASFQFTVPSLATNNGTIPIDQVTVSGVGAPSDQNPALYGMNQFSIQLDTLVGGYSNVWLDVLSGTTSDITGPGTYSFLSTSLTGYWTPYPYTEPHYYFDTFTNYGGQVVVARNTIPVPEPGILILLGISMASIVGLRRRWKE